MVKKSDGNKTVGNKFVSSKLTVMLGIGVVLILIICFLFFLFRGNFFSRLPIPLLIVIIFIILVTGVVFKNTLGSINKSASGLREEMLEEGEKILFSGQPYGVVTVMGLPSFGKRSVTVTNKSIWVMLRPMSKFVYNSSKAGRPKWFGIFSRYLKRKIDSYSLEGNKLVIESSTLKMTLSFPNSKKIYNIIKKYRKD